MRVLYILATGSYSFIKNGKVQTLVPGDEIVGISTQYLSLFKSQKDKIEIYSENINEDAFLSHASSRDYNIHLTTDKEVTNKISDSIITELEIVPDHIPEDVSQVESDNSVETSTTVEDNQELDSYIKFISNECTIKIGEKVEVEVELNNFDSEYKFISDDSTICKVGVSKMKGISEGSTKLHIVVNDDTVDTMVVNVIK